MKAESDSDWEVLERVAYAIIGERTPHAGAAHRLVRLEAHDGGGNRPGCSRLPGRTGAYGKSGGRVLSFSKAKRRLAWKEITIEKPAEN